MQQQYIACLHFSSRETARMTVRALLLCDQESASVDVEIRWPHVYLILYRLYQIDTVGWSLSMTPMLRTPILRSRGD